MTGAIKNSFWYLVFNFSRLFIVFFGSMWVSRNLGPDVFGQFSYYLSIIVYISTIDSLCHDSVVKQQLSSVKDIGTTLGSASLLNLFLSVISVTSIVLISLIFIKDYWQIMIFLLFIPGQLTKAFNPLAGLFDIKLLSKYSSMALFLGAAISTLFRVFSVSLTTDLRWQSLGYSLQTLVYGFLLYWLYRRHLSSYKWRISYELLIGMTKKSFPIFLAALIYLTISLSDILMIRHTLGLREVGIYSVVVRLCEPWVIVSSALCTSYFPIIFNHGHNIRKQNKIFINANQISIIFILVMGILLSLSIDHIVSILLGSHFSEVAGVFKIYFWSVLFLFFANIQHIWEVYNGKYALSLYKTSITCVLKILLNFALGSRFGIQGFAMATFISLFFYGMCFNLLFKETKPYFNLQVRAFTLGEFRKNYRFLRQKGLRWFKRKF